MLKGTPTIHKILATIPVVNVTAELVNGYMQENGGRRCTIWDLDQIVAQNNKAALDYMMDTQKVNEAQEPMPVSWALSILSGKMLAGPVSISALIDYFMEYKLLDHFVALVKEFLPEYEDQIMSQTGGQRVYKFCSFFRDKYYPLPVGAWTAPMDYFTSGLPAYLMGLGYSTYHDLEMRPGYLLLLSLVVYPFEGDFRDEIDDDVPFDPGELPASKYKPSRSDIAWVRNLVDQIAVGGQWIAPMGFVVTKLSERCIVLKEAQNTPKVKEVIQITLKIAESLGIEARYSNMGRTSEEKINGARIPLLEKIKTIVGADLTNCVPSSGWLPKYLHDMTDGTKYEGVGDFADWACKETKTFLLDAGYDNCHYRDGESEPLFLWSKSNVELLTRQWPKVKRIRENIDHIVLWLEENPPVHFAELLGYLLLKERTMPKVNTQEITSSYDPTEIQCWLEQPGEDEEEGGEAYDNINEEEDAGEEIEPLALRR